MPHILDPQRPDKLSFGLFLDLFFENDPPVLPLVWKAVAAVGEEMFFHPIDGSDGLPPLLYKALPDYNYYVHVGHKQVGIKVRLPVVNRKLALAGFENAEQDLHLVVRRLSDELGSAFGRNPSPPAPPSGPEVQ